MKKIEAIVRPHRVDDVKEALAKLNIRGMTVTEVRGFGRQRGQTETYRGAEYVADFVPKIKIEIATDDSMARQIIDAIVEVAQTGNVGDGKIFVYDLSSAVRIRTRETQEAAL